MATIDGKDFVCEDLSFPYPALKESWTALWFGGREESYADGWPGIFASVRGSSRLQEPTGGLPTRERLYPSFNDLLEEVSAFNPYHGWRDARRNQCNLFLWDQRARIAQVDSAKDEILVRIEGPDVHQLQLLGRVRSEGAETQVRAPATSLVRHAVKGEPLAGNLCLVNEDLETVDEVYWDKPMAAFIRAWEERQDAPRSPVTVINTDKIVNNTSHTTSNITNSTVGANAVGPSASARGRASQAPSASPSQAEYLAHLKEIQHLLVEHQERLDEIDERLYEALNQFLRIAKGVQIEQMELRAGQEKLLGIFEALWTKNFPTEAKPSLADGSLRFIGELLRSPLTAEVAKKFLEP